MDLQPNAAEDQIIDSAAKYLKDNWPLSRHHRAGSHKFGLKEREGFAALGWLGIGLDEESGGVGFSIVEEMLFYRELGRYLGPTGVLPIACAAKITAPSDKSLTARFIEGRHRVALAFSVTPPADRDSIAGEFRMFDVEAAEYAVFVEPGRSSVLDLRQVAFELTPCLDKSASMARIEVDGIPLIAQLEGGDLHSAARLCSAAMLVGIAEAVTEMIVEYAKIRETFGRAIGAYQAVRHPCAEMAVRTEAARAQLFYAGVALRDRRRDAELQVDAAKALANEAALMNVDANIQLHGGIGTTDEHDAHLYMKRAHLLNHWFGSNSAVYKGILHASIAA